MENIQPPQNGTVTAVEPLVEESFKKELFVTTFRSYDINHNLMDGMSFTDSEFIDLVSQYAMEETTSDLTALDNKYIDKMREIIYTICQDLPEFNTEMQYTPYIVGSNAMFQGKMEHIPLHCYEHVPLVFTFVLHTGEYTPPTYFADPRGGVQAIRHLAQENLVECSFQVKGRIGEVMVTPGHLMRYTETNLDTQSYVTLNVKIGFGR